MIEDTLERLWSETNNYISKGEGGYVIVANPSTMAYYPVDFNGNINDNNQIVVDSEQLAKVAMMFWRPDACKESVNLWLSWLKSEGMNIKVANQDLSSNLLQFRAANKERLFAIARSMISQPVKVQPGRVISIKVKPKTKAKPAHKNKAIVGTAVATPVLAALSFIHHTLPAPISTIVIGVIAFVLSVVEHIDYKQIIEEVES